MVRRTEEEPFGNDGEILGRMKKETKSQASELLNVVQRWPKSKEEEVGFADSSRVKASTANLSSPIKNRIF